MKAYWMPSVIVEILQAPRTSVVWDVPLIRVIELVRLPLSKPRKPDNITNP